jgi:hypothetical protein
MMLNLIGRRKRIALFSYRPQLRSLNKQIEKAAFEIDAALVEELMEEKRRYVESLF